MIQPVQKQSEFCKTFQNRYFTVHLWKNAYDQWYVISQKQLQKVTGAIFHLPHQFSGKLWKTLQFCGLVSMNKVYRSFI